MENSDSSSNTQQLDVDNGHKAPAPERESTDSKQQAAQQQPDVPGTPKKRGRRLILIVLLGVGAVAGVIFGYRWWRYASTHSDTDDAYVTGHLHQLNSRINDTVAQVLVDDNQLVHQGQLLVKLDPHDFQVQVQQAEANLEAARRQASAAQTNITLAQKNTLGQTTQAQGNIKASTATIANAQAAVAQAQAVISSNQAQLVQAQADLRKTQADYIRYNRLYQEGVIDRSSRDAYKASYEVDVAKRNAATQQVRQAQAQLVAAQKQVANAQGQLLTSKGGLLSAQATTQQTKVNQSQYQAAIASIAQAAAQLKNAQLQLSYTNIYAPTDGRVGNKTVEVGNRVQPGQALMTIVEPNPWVVANFKETQLKKMRPGQRAQIKIDAIGGHTFVGHVDSIAPGSGATFALLPSDNATGNFTKIVQRIPVKIIFDPQSVKGYESRTVPGMSTEVSVEHP